LLAALLRVALVDGRLSVIDFGGSLGTSWRQNRKYLDGLPVRWRVVEQPGFVEAGRRHFEGDVLSFHLTIEDAAAAGDANVALLGSVLNWVEHPVQILDRLAATTVSHLILDRTVVTDASRDVISIQRVPAAIYPASYPIRKFSRRTLEALLANDWRIIESWTCEHQPDHRARFVGYFCERRSARRGDTPQ
jgi:putative methyltransferase (TIGR04325 family)